MAALGAVDVALLPVWGWGPTLGPGHLDPVRAAEAVELIRPRIVVPVHWGTLGCPGLASGARSAGAAHAPPAGRPAARLRRDGRRAGPSGTRVAVTEPGEPVALPVPR